MAKSEIALAQVLLDGGADALEELRIHEFRDDEEAHDDQTIAKLYAAFSSEFDRVVIELSKAYGAPERMGKEGDQFIPLSGVFNFAVWSVGAVYLYVAAAHEDRGVPILLMLGTADREAV